MTDVTWKTLDLINEATQFLASREIENPRLDTELLLAAALGIRRIDLYLQFERILQAGEVETFRAHVRQRLNGCPVQYITGEAGFRLLDLEVTPAVLIPRPETELLVEHALPLAEQGATTALDLCCGSGAIAISLATEATSLHVTGSDLSSEAIRVARRNRDRHDMNQRLQLVCGDLFAPLGTDVRFDMIITNPPYIGSAEIEDLQPEVRDHEPRLALDGGADGLDVVRRIVAGAVDHLTPGGHVLIEVGHTQAEQVVDLMSGRQLEATVHEDLADIPRIVIGRLG
ncbi:MAG: peptide chain release factor N(5)-glutamine methyltransferase [Candidatus Latescibacterota bacterium]|nr:peptide chain release factor N(5)-glutamine methyltransferase [Candidatus Latescibacterota bacterium]